MKIPFTYEHPVNILLYTLACWSWYKYINMICYLWMFQYLFNIYSLHTFSRIRLVQHDLMVLIFCYLSLSLALVIHSPSLSLSISLFLFRSSTHPLYLSLSLQQESQLKMLLVGCCKPNVSIYPASI